MRIKPEKGEKDAEIFSEKGDRHWQRQVGVRTADHSRPRTRGVTRPYRNSVCRASIDRAIYENLAANKLGRDSAQYNSTFAQVIHDSGCDGRKIPYANEYPRFFQECV